jgi:steroid delta-isomerase-like uncharacterized protein
MSGAIEALADRWQEAWSGRDRDAFAHVCAADVHYEDPFTAPPLRGTVAIGEHAARLWAAFPDVRMESSGERLCDGRFAALPVRVCGTNTEPLDWLPASHRFIALHVVFWCELDSGRHRLWRIRAFCDGYAAAVALGILPARGSLRERALLMLQGYGLRVRR